MVDEDDNGKFRLEGVKPFCELIIYEAPYSSLNTNYTNPIIQYIWGGGGGRVFDGCKLFFAMKVRHYFFMFR